MRGVHKSRCMKAESSSPGSLGLRLREYRLTLGLSQAEMARKLGMRRSMISLIELGRRDPSATLLHRFANAFRINGQPLFLLSNPQAKLLGAAHVAANHAAWRAFAQDNHLLARYNVTSEELRILSTVRIMGEVSE